MSRWERDKGASKAPDWFWQAVETPASEHRVEVEVRLDEGRGRQATLGLDLQCPALGQPARETGDAVPPYADVDRALEPGRQWRSQPARERAIGRGQPPEDRE